MEALAALPPIFCEFIVNFKQFLSSSLNYTRMSKYVSLYKYKKYLLHFLCYVDVGGTQCVCLRKWS